MEHRSPRASLRTRLGISQDRVAELSGISRPSIDRYELNAAAVGADIRARLDQIYASFATTLRTCAAHRKVPRAGTVHAE